MEDLDTTIHLLKFSLSNNTLMSEEVYKNGKHVGIWKNYNSYGKLTSELRCPQIAIENNISGKVYIRFIVEKNGNVKVHSIAKSQHAFLDYEAWMVIEKMPKWNPGTYKGKPVDCYDILPITFMMM